MLGGCESYVAKDIQPASSAATLETRSLADAGLTKFISAHGLKAQDDWNLDRFTLTALFFNPDLAVARAELAGAKGDTASAAEWPNPSINLSPGYNVDAAPGQTPWILGYTLTIPIDVSGQRAHRAVGAEKRQTAARFRLTAAAWNARASVRLALAELHAADNAAKIWQALRPTIGEARQALAAQSNAGEISAAESAQARLLLDRTELSARDAERSRLAARAKLAESIGVPLSALRNINISFRGLGNFARAPQASQARLWAAQHRADVLAALAEYDAAQADLQVEIARQYPDISVGPGYQLDQGEGKWSLGLDINLPLFNRNAGAIAGAQAKRSALAAKFESLQLHVLAEVEQACAGYTAAAADLITLVRMETDLAVSAKHLAAQKKTGEISALESARQLIDQADSLIAAQAARQRTEQALAALEMAVQRPLRLMNFEQAAIPSELSNIK